MSPLNEKTATSPFVAAPFEATHFNSDSFFIESKFVESPHIESPYCESPYCESLDEAQLFGITDSEATPREKKPHNIQIRETVPDHFTSFGSLDAWRNMARRRAFDAMLERVKSHELVRAQCHLSEEWQQRSASGERNLIITCDLNYWVEDAQSL